MKILKDKIKDHSDMSEWYLILCILKFLYNVDFNF